METYNRRDALKIITVGPLVLNSLLLKEVLGTIHDTKHDLINLLNNPNSPIPNLSLNDLHELISDNDFFAYLKNRKRGMYELYDTFGPYGIKIKDFLLQHPKTLIKTPLNFESYPGSSKTKFLLNGLLGLTQHKNIIDKYNNYSGDKVKQDKKCKDYFSCSDYIIFPLVYDTLGEFFDENFLKFLLRKLMINKFSNINMYKDTIVVTRHNGKTVLGAYKDGKLLIGTYVSTGKEGFRTPSGVFNISLKQSYKRSIKYEDEPMPYSMQVYGNIFLHHGISNGKPRSHGCIRVPGIYQEIIFNRFRLGSQVIINL